MYDVQVCCSSRQRSFCRIGNLLLLGQALLLRTLKGFLFTPNPVQESEHLKGRPDRGATFCPTIRAMPLSQPRRRASHRCWRCLRPGFQLSAVAREWGRSSCLKTTIRCFFQCLCPQPSRQRKARPFDAAFAARATSTSIRCSVSIRRALSSSRSNMPFILSTASSSAASPVSPLDFEYRSAAPHGNAPRFARHHGSAPPRSALAPPPRLG